MRRFFKAGLVGMSVLMLATGCSKKAETDTETGATSASDAAETTAEYVEGELKSLGEHKGLSVEIVEVPEITDADVEAQIQEQIAQMYVLRSTYVSKLESIAQAAIDEYTQGEHTAENKADVVYKRLEELTALEKECDAQVAQVVERLRSLLKQAGKDDSLAKQVEATYQEEKSLKKAAYLEEFRNG